MNCATCHYSRLVEVMHRMPRFPVRTETFLRCHIRSVPDQFPRREPNDWCGEHVAARVAYQFPGPE